MRVGQLNSPKVQAEAKFAAVWGYGPEALRLVVTRRMRATAGDYYFILSKPISNLRLTG